MADDAKKLPTFESGVMYRVQLEQAFKVGPITMAPGKTQRLDGAVCEANRDKILTAERDEQQAI